MSSVVLLDLERRGCVIGEHHRRVKRGQHESRRKRVPRALRRSAVRVYMYLDRFRAFSELCCGRSIRAMIITVGDDAAVATDAASTSRCPKHYRKRLRIDRDLERITGSRARNELVGFPRFLVFRMPRGCRRFPLRLLPIFRLPRRSFNRAFGFLRFALNASIPSSELI